MNNASSNPANRQVLVNLGNRFVLFGRAGGFPETRHFDPKDSAILPRVADESEIAESRIVETIQVSGMTRGDADLQRAGNADVELIDATGNRVLVEIKVRERDPRERDLKTGAQLLERAQSQGQSLEIWFFNIERLKLTTMRFDGPNLQFDELVPLNVWEKTADGIFERQRVIDEVDDWLRRVERLYLDVQKWLEGEKDLRFEQTRTVPMSEEMMQKFAVADRELPVLDVLLGDQVVASFVPRGLWLIGAWGRIDVITKDGTSILVAIKSSDKLEWQLASSDDRRRMSSFDKAALLALVGGQ